MSPEALELLCQKARARLAASINRSAAQQLRRFRDLCKKTLSSACVVSAGSYQF